MFIHVVYKDTPELSDASTTSRFSSDADLAIEKTLLVNPKCPVRIILEYIRKQCKLGCYTNFDLCEESGLLLGLFNMPTYSYATEQFQHKKTYYLVVFKTGTDKRMSILPQLNRDNLFYNELKEKVRRCLAGELSSVAPTPTPPKSVTTTTGKTKK